MSKNTFIDFNNIKIGIIVTLVISSILGASVSGQFLVDDILCTPSALGGAYTAVTGSEDALHYNPGSGAFMKKSSISISHKGYPEKVNAQNLSFFFNKLIPNFKLGLSGTMFSSFFTGMDRMGRDIGDFYSRDTSLTLHLSKDFNNLFFQDNRIGIGLNIKTVNLTAFSYKDSIIMLDAGVTLQAWNEVFLGAAIRNLGYSFTSGLGKSSLTGGEMSGNLPLELRVGIASEMLENKLRPSLDILATPTKTSFENPGVNIGLAIMPVRTYQFFGGVSIRIDKGNAYSVGVGTDLSLSDVTLKLAYSLRSFPDFGLNHLFSLSFNY